MWRRPRPGGRWRQAATGSTGGFLAWLCEKVLGLGIGEALSLAEKVGPGSEHVFFPPGDRSPFYNPSMAPALLGLWPRGESREEVVGRVVRSVLLGIALLERSYIDLFEELFKVRIGEVRISGGGTRSRFWNSLRAAVYGRRVRVFGERVAVGTLIPAAIKAGVCRSVDDAEKRFLKVVDTLEPDPRLSEVYRGLAQRFMDAWRRLGEVYGALR